MKLFIPLLMVAIVATCGILAAPAHVPDPSSDESTQEEETDLCPAKVDVYFILDSSASITESEFWKTIAFVKDIAKNVKIGEDHVLFGAVMYSYSAVNLFYPSDSKNLTQVIKGLDSSSYLGRSTNIELAFNRLIQDGFLEPYRGARVGIKKVGIAITDGNFTRPDRAGYYANKLKVQLGVKIIAIAVGVDIKMDGLLLIASSPSDIFRVDDYDESLSRIKDDVMSDACRDSMTTTEEPTPTTTTTPPPPPPPTTTTSEEPTTTSEEPTEPTTTSEEPTTTSEEPTEPTTTSEEPTTTSEEPTTPSEEPPTTTTSPPMESDLCPVKADIIFVLDASAKAKLRLQISFVLGIAGLVTIDHAHVQFGAVLYGGMAGPLFQLKDSVSFEKVKELLEYAYQADTSNMMSSVSQPLDVVSQYAMFDPSSGGRPDAVKVIIFLTAGVNLPQNIHVLGEAGVKILVVGLSVDVRADVLLSIASSSSGVFRIDECDETLASVEDQVLAEACIADDDGTTEQCVDESSDESSSRSWH